MCVDVGVCVRVYVGVIVCACVWVRVCVCVNFVIQHAMRVPHMSSVTCPALQYFPHYIIIGTILEENVTEQKPCVSISSTTFV